MTETGWRTKFTRSFWQMLTLLYLINSALGWPSRFREHGTLLGWFWTFLPDNSHARIFCTRECFNHQTPQHKIKPEFRWLLRDMRHFNSHAKWGESEFKLYPNTQHIWGARASGVVSQKRSCTVRVHNGISWKSPALGPIVLLWLLFLWLVFYFCLFVCEASRSEDCGSEYSGREYSGNEYSNIGSHWIFLVSYSFLLTVTDCTGRISKFFVRDGLRHLSCHLIK